MNKIISVEILGKKGHYTYLHGSETAIQSFKNWLAEHNACLSNENNLLISKQSFNDCLLEAMLCGLRPSRLSTFI